MITATQPITQDNYRSFPAVANSDLSWLEHLDDKRKIDCEQAFKMGTLIDGLITEMDRRGYYNEKGDYVDAVYIDLFKRTVGGVVYSKEEIAEGKKMKVGVFNVKSYRDEDSYKSVMNLLDPETTHFQHISYQPAFEIEYQGVKFSLPAKAKWDLKKKHFKFGGDIKSTTATTWLQCWQAVDYFNYDRSRAWYMDLEGHTMDYLIFISKKNFKVFIIPVCSIDYGLNATAGQKQAYELYARGRAKYQELAFEYWKLF